MLTIALAQHDFLVGDIRGNLGKALGLVAEARGTGADLLLLPEMALTGYPPEDLLLRPGFLAQAGHTIKVFNRTDARAQRWAEDSTSRATTPTAY